jgi:hypothetical protein
MNTDKEIGFLFSSSVPHLWLKNLRRMPEPMPQKIPSSTAAPHQSVAIWALVQLALLGIGATGFPLWAHHPLPRESLALPELLCGQILIIAMLFPLLGISAWAIAINLMLMLPFDALAGLLSSTPRVSMLRGFGAAGLWLLGLTGWRRFLDRSSPGSDHPAGALFSESKQCPRGTTATRNRFNHLVVTAALLFTAGGAIWDYLRWEAALSDGRGGSFTALSILPQTCHFLGENTWLAWLECATPLLLLLSVVIFSTLLRQGPKPPSTSLHQSP